MRTTSLVITGLLIAAAGCGGGADAITQPDASTTQAPPTLKISLSETVVLVGQTAEVSVTKTGADGKPISGGVVNWTLSNTAIAHVVPSGDRAAKITAFGPGDVVIEASLDGLLARTTLSIAAPGQAASFIYSEEQGFQFIPPPSGSRGMRALAINDAGQVVGEVIRVRSSAFLWSAADGITDIGDAMSGTGTVATAISQNGQVAGYYVDASTGASQPMPFHWTRATGIVGLKVPETAIYALANGINNAGDIVGQAFFPDATSPTIRAIRWTADGAPEFLAASSDGSAASARAINDAGQIAGISYQSDGDEPFQCGGIFWSASGVRTDFAKCESSSSLCCWSAGAYAINRDGVVAGTDGIHAITWSTAAGTKLISGFSIYAYKSEATGINDRGDVAGTFDATAGFYNTLGYSHVGFIFTAEKGLKEIMPPPGYNVITLTGINNKGQVVGYAQ